VSAYDRADLAAIYRLACDLHPQNPGRRDAWFGGYVAEYFGLNGSRRAVYEITDEAPVLRSGQHDPRHAPYPDTDGERPRARHRRRPVDDDLTEPIPCVPDHRRAA
jgi:hypothetical protein